MFSKTKYLQTDDWFQKMESNDVNIDKILDIQHN